MTAGSAGASWKRKDGRMVIVSKDRTSLSNMEYVASIYIAGDRSIKANIHF